MTKIEINAVAGVCSPAISGKQKWWSCDQTPDKAKFNVLSCTQNSTMQKLLYTFFICFSFIVLNAQEKLLVEPLQIKTSKIRTHILDNSSNDSLLTIVIDKKEIYFQLLDNTFQILQKTTAQKPKMKSLGYIHHYYEDGIYYIYFSNVYVNKNSSFSEKQNSIFYLISYDTHNKEVSQKEFPIPDDYDTYLTSFDRKGKTCMMFIGNKTSSLYFYTFDKENVIENNKVSLEDYKFGRYAKSSLFQIITKSEQNIFLASYPVYLETINKDWTTILKKVNSKVKVYPFEEEIILSIDERKFSTRLFSINLSDFSHQYQEVKHHKTICDDASYSIDSNSFLLDQNLIQISRCPEQISLSIYNLIDKTFTQTFQAQEKDGIFYKNSPFILFEELYTSSPTHRKKLNYKKAFKRFSKGTISILPIYYNNYIEISVSANQENKNVNAMGFVNGIPITSYSFGNLLSRHIYFKSLIDENSFEHIKEDAKKNILDQINDLQFEYEKKPNFALEGKAIFKHKDYYILAYYLNPEGQFILRKFMN